MLRSYETEEARTILAGLLQGSRKRQPMSDAEYRAKMDPHGEFDTKLLSYLKDIRDFFEDRGRQQAPAPRPRPVPTEPWRPESSGTGGVALP